MRSIERLKAAALLSLVLVPAQGALAEPAATLDAAAVEAWADRTFSEALANTRISGAVVSFVEDGEILLEKGYGQGDVVAGTPAGPRTTRVRIGSTTKTFTATLLAQLMEEGRIGSVDDPVNDYLDRYEMPDNAAVPVTLRHLLTHSAGFEDRFFHIGAIDPVTVPATADMIESLRPAFVRPAGDRVDYSNFGVATLGWVIEDLVGLPIDRYMSQRIFEPLGMTRTELVVDVGEPEELAVPGVLDVDGVVGPTPFTAINPAVAQTGSIVSTAHDMALYMNAQLGESPTPGPAVIRRLQTPLAGNAPMDEGLGVTELGMVYFLDRWGSQAMVSHGGNWAGFHTWMLLLPDRRAGLFVSLLSEAQPRGLVDRFLAAALPSLARPASPASLSAYSYVNEFMVEFFGAKRELATVPLAPAELQQYAGFYRADRRPFETLEALSSLVYFGGDVMEVSAGEGGLYLGGAGPWLPEGRGRFILDVPTRPRMVIRTDAVGDAVLTPDIGIYTFSRIGALANPKWQAILVHLLLPLTLLGFAAAGKLRANPRLWAPFAIAAAGAVMVACSIAGLEPGESIMDGYFSGHPLRVVLFAAAANVQLLATLATLALAPGAAGRTSRRLQLALALMGLLIAAILAQYNIIGLHRI